MPTRSPDPSRTPETPEGRCPGGETPPAVHLPDPERQHGAHAATLARMAAEAPSFRPEATCAELVEAFVASEDRFPAFLALYGRGTEALPAVRDGLAHRNPDVRRWCAAFLDNVADSASLEALVPLLEDPVAKVRVWAVHALACEDCKDGPNPVDAIPLLLDRVARDRSLRVRRQAVAMLAHHRAPDRRAAAAFDRILREEEDRKLRLHASHGLRRCAEAGVYP